MPTVIDTLIVELGLDPKKLTDAQKKVVADTKKWAEGQRKAAQEVEDANQKAADSFNKIKTEALSMAAVLIGASSVEQFVAQQVRLNIELGRTAKFLGENVTQLSAWRNVATIAGADADSLTGSMSGIVHAIQSFSVTGQPNEVINWFRRLGIQVSDVKTGKMRDISELWLDLADRFSHMDPLRANAIGQAMGIDETSIALLIKGRGALEGLLDKQKELGNVTDKDVDATFRLTAAWNSASQAATSAGRSMLTEFTPALEKVLYLTAGILSNNERGQLLFRGLSFDPRSRRGTHETAWDDIRNSLLGSDADVHKDLQIGPPPTTGKPSRTSASPATGGPTGREPAQGMTDRDRRALIHKYGDDPEAALRSLPIDSPEWQGMYDYVHQLINNGYVKVTGGKSHLVKEPPVAPRWGRMHSNAHPSTVQAIHGASGTAPSVITAPPGSGGGASFAVIGGPTDRRTITSSSDVTIGTLVLPHSAAQNGNDLARDLVAGLRNSRITTSANNGPQ